MEDMQNESAPQQSSASVGADAVAQHKLWAILGYIIPILFFIPLVNESSKHNTFARFHANQQLLLFITWAIGWVLMMFIAVLGMVVYLFALILMIIGIVNAAGGKMKRLPLVGGFTLIQ